MCLYTYKSDAVSSKTELEVERFRHHNTEIHDDDDDDDGGHTKWHVCVGLHTATALI